MRQKGFVEILILVLVIVVVIAGGVYYLGTVKNSKSQPQIPVVTSNSSPQTTSPSSGSSQALPLPVDNDWIKYQAQCQPLKDNTEIYYPRNWLYKEFNNVSDTLDPTNQSCQIIFAYPGQPDSYQAPSPGEIARLTIATFLSTNETLDYYLTAIENQDPKPSLITKINVNGTNYTRLDFTDTIYPKVYTAKGNRFFVIKLINKIDPISGAQLNIDSITINNEFLKRIKILN